MSLTFYERRSGIQTKENRSLSRTTSCVHADTGVGIPQASAAFPENTMASFELAIRDGAEGVESGTPKFIMCGTRRPPR